MGEAKRRGRRPPDGDKLTNSEIKAAQARAIAYADAHPLCDEAQCIPTAKALRAGHLIVNALGQVRVTPLGLQTLRDEMGVPVN
jgi:hypothetical protein